MRDYYTDFLKTKISVNTLPNEVSKVSKGQNLDTKQAFDTFDTALLSVNQKNSFSKNDGYTGYSFFATRAMMQSFQPEQSISRKLDAMIEAGASFDVTEDSFEVIGGEQLTETDRQYLTTNKMPVLCTLHQRLLMKHWFNDSPELLESFAFDIFERESILAEENELYTYETYYEAVSETSQKWFINLLDAIPD